MDNELDASEEIRKLKKRISALEEENEDLEDSFNAKLKKERRQFEEEKSQIEYELRKAKQGLENADEQTSQYRQDVALQEKSLHFVTQILNAKVNDEMGNLYQCIDAIGDYLKDLRKCADDYFSTDKDCFNYIDIDKNWENYILGEGYQRWKLTSRKKWIANKTAIAFVGEFSAGKTSIVNRIYTQDNPDVPRLPVSSKASTAIPTYITGGYHRQYQFVSPDNVLKKIDEETFTNVKKEVLDKIDGVSALLKYFVMECENPYLNNFSILDTPGFSSNDTTDAIRTIDVINECDALFWVFDVNAGTVNKSSIQLIKEHLTKPLYVVINKVDTKSEYDVQKTEKLIKDTLSSNGIDVQRYIRFSEKTPLADIMNCINAVTHDDNADRYLGSLKDYVDYLISIYRNILSTMIRESTDTLTEAQQMENKTLQLAIKLQEHCEQIGKMGIDDYGFLGMGDPSVKFSQSEYNSLISYLNKIYDGVRDFYTNFDEYGMQAISYSAQYQNKCDAEFRLERLKGIRSKIIDKLKEGGFDLNKFHDEFEIIGVDILNTDIDCNVLNNAVNDKIPYSTSRYLMPSLKVVGYQKGNYDVYWKLYSPDGLHSNENSPEGYSYKNTITIGNGASTVRCSGWGGNTAGNWKPGEYIFEFYFKNKLMYVKAFTVTAAPEEFEITSVEIINGDYDGNIINRGYEIPSSNTNYIGSILGLKCHKAGTYDIYVKFYTPNGLSLASGDNAPEDYSFKIQMPINNNTTTYQVMGWGGKDAGHWKPGEYSVQYYYNDNLLISVPFVVTDDISTQSAPEPAYQPIEEILQITSAEIINTDNSNNVINRGNRIPCGQSRFIGALLTLNCYKAGAYDIYVKFYTPDGLSIASGSNAPQDYSFKTQLNMKVGTFVERMPGWGSDNAGQWGPGEYHIEYYYDGKLIQYVPFTVY